MSDMLQAINVHKTYRNGPTSIEVLRGIDLAVKEGESLAVLGQSGAGKSTLLHILGALDVPTAGEVRHRGANLGDLSGPALADKRNKIFGFVFQFYHLLPDFTAIENVILPAMVGTDGWRRWLGARALKRQMKAKASELLGRVGLAGRETHRPNHLSGGERQRVAIARALMNDPEILLFDEPSGNLDSKTSAGIQDLIWELNRTQRKTVVLVTHEAALAQRADRVVRILDGRIVDGA
jgi:lipoprotein-releasing system ATP-binding protein